MWCTCTGHPALLDMTVAWISCTGAKYRTRSTRTSQGCLLPENEALKIGAEAMGTPGAAYGRTRPEVLTPLRWWRAHSGIHKSAHMPVLSGSGLKHRRSQQGLHLARQPACPVLDMRLPDEARSQSFVHLFRTVYPATTPDRHHSNRELGVWVRTSEIAHAHASTSVCRATRSGASKEKVAIAWSSLPLRRPRSNLCS